MKAREGRGEGAREGRGEGVTSEGGQGRASQGGREDGVSGDVASGKGTGVWVCAIRQLATL